MTGYISEFLPVGTDDYLCLGVVWIVRLRSDNPVYGPDIIRSTVIVHP